MSKPNKMVTGRRVSVSSPASGFLDYHFSIPQKTHPYQIAAVDNWFKVAKNLEASWLQEVADALPGKREAQQQVIQFGTSVYQQLKSHTGHIAEVGCVETPQVVHGYLVIKVTTLHFIKADSVVSGTLMGSITWPYDLYVAVKLPSLQVFLLRAHGGLINTHGFADHLTTDGGAWKSWSDQVKDVSEVMTTETLWQDCAHRLPLSRASIKNFAKKLVQQLLRCGLGKMAGTAGTATACDGCPHQLDCLTHKPS